MSLLPKINKANSKNQKPMRQNEHKICEDRIQFKETNNLNPVHENSRNLQKIVKKQIEYQKIQIKDQSLKRKQKAINLNKKANQLQAKKRSQSDLDIKRHNRMLTEGYKQQCVLRDKNKHPLKYKIIAQCIGVKDEKAYELKCDQVMEIQRKYIKDKGLDNLREGGKNINKSASTKSANYNSYINKIFRIDKQIPKHGRSGRSLHLSQNQKELKEKDKVIGKLVFERVKNLLKKEKQSRSFVNTIQNINKFDDAFIDHLKLKISRAQRQIIK